MRNLILLPLLSAFGCATIMHGSSQDLSVASTPTSAVVSIDNQDAGHTPVMRSLKRGDPHTVKVSMPGYMPYEVILTKNVSGWVIGNILFGGLIGLAVDAITGGLYYLTPEQVQTALVQQQQAAPRISQNNGVYLMVTLQPDPAWQLVAQLERSDR
jgi:hypothetical protein